MAAVNRSTGEESVCVCVCERESERDARGWTWRRGLRCALVALTARLGIRNGRNASGSGHANGRENEGGLYSCLLGRSQARQVVYMCARREAIS